MTMRKLNEIRELNIDELDAVSGGAVDTFIWFVDSSGDRLAGEPESKPQPAKP
jgi:bacteriocin-like protein